MKEDQDRLKIPAEFGNRWKKEWIGNDYHGKKSISIFPFKVKQH